MNAIEFWTRKVARKEASVRCKVQDEMVDRMLKRGAFASASEKKITVSSR